MSSSFINYDLIFCSDNDGARGDLEGYHRNIRDYSEEDQEFKEEALEDDHAIIEDADQDDDRNSDEVDGDDLME